MTERRLGKRPTTEVWDTVKRLNDKTERACWTALLLLPNVKSVAYEAESFRVDEPVWCEVNGERKEKSVTTPDFAVELMDGTRVLVEATNGRGKNAQKVAQFLVMYGAGSGDSYLQLTGYEVQGLVALALEHGLADLEEVAVVLKVEMEQLVSWRKHAPLVVDSKHPVMHSLLVGVNGYGS